MLEPNLRENVEKSGMNPPMIRAILALDTALDKAFKQINDIVNFPELDEALETFEQAAKSHDAFVVATTSRFNLQSEMNAKLIETIDLLINVIVDNVPLSSDTLKQLTSKNTQTRKDPS